MKDNETLTTELLREQREMNRRKDKLLAAMLAVIVLLIGGMVALSLYHDWQWSQFETVSIDTDNGQSAFIGNDNIGGVFNVEDRGAEAQGREGQGNLDPDGGGYRQRLHRWRHRSPPEKGQQGDHRERGLCHPAGRWNMILSEFTGPECERLRLLCNFTEEERAVFDLRVNGKPRDFIADVLGMSLSTVDRRLRRVRRKIMRVV